MMSLSPEEEESWTSLLCDLELENFDFLDEPDTNWLDESFPSEQNLQSFSTDSNPSCSTFIAENCSSTLSNTSSGDDDNNFKTLKINANDSPCCYVLSFANENQAPTLNFDSTLKPKDNAVNVNHHENSSLPSKRSLESQKKEPKRKVQERIRTPHQVQDHILAERKRREKIGLQFIALSALIPGLKKIDKATVLGDAIQHVKQLQEQVKLLEEQAKRKSAESVVYVEKSKSSAVDESVSDISSNSGTANNMSLPEIDARVSENKVLIRIHCKKQEGVLMNILREIENLHLSVINNSTLPFGTSKLEMTIITEMDDEFKLSMKELAKQLRAGFLQFV